MLEWLSSKVAVSMAALVIMASVGGFLHLQRENFREQELVEVADRIAEVVNDVSLMGSETSLLIVFGDGGGISMPKEVMGSPYDLEIHRDMIRCSQEGRSATAFLYKPVHLYPPSSVDLSDPADILEHDLENPILRTDSIGGLMVKRSSVGDGSYETFIFAGEVG